MRTRVAVAGGALEEVVQAVQFMEGRLTHSLWIGIFTDKGLGTEMVQG